MRSAVVVIGCSFGDEGKGRVVDALATPGTAVVRFNGGAQAAHTVQVEGRRHIFSHFGAGTLKGATTILSRFFVCNPVIFANEGLELRDWGVTPKVYVDPLCPLTTPYDVEINRAIERARSKGKHGSCGVGFGETVYRDEGNGPLLRFITDNVPARMDDIALYARERLKELGLNPAPALHAAEEGMYRWNACLEYMRGNVTIKRDSVATCEAAAVIYEGAQGLLLDQNRKEYFPHLTRSSTGLNNAVRLAHLANIEVVNPIYVTRTYLTRHGAGPLPGEDPTLAYSDPTNAANEWQGALRFAPLDLELLKRTVREDAGVLARLNTIQLAVTCVDQFGDEAFLDKIEEVTEIPVRYASYGAERDALVERRMGNLKEALVAT